MVASLRLPELLIILIIFGAFYLVPAVAAVWALVTLHRIRTGQEALRLRLETIERLLQGSRSPG